MWCSSPACEWSPTRPLAPFEVTSRIETSRDARPSTCDTRPISDSLDGRSSARTTSGGGTSSTRNQAAGTSSASAIAMRQPSDGEALSFSIWER